ncbi:hypothetical protein B0A49_10918 [Cryomyces minteri]|uniref:Mannose-6-phosphate isomerase n=1 Tax=Cryomyces minteri TaxID=331657 RepID=A0A4U0WN35_9PEZI|nr:hypothetical protein B0A49_10918 [Cryomyces minteri]
MTVDSVLQLKCSCNQYPWGKKGSESLAARLAAKTPGWDENDKGNKTDFKIDEERFYSEMWMGTYPVLPSYVLSTGEDLQDVIDKNPDELIGKGVMNKFGHTKLPYLPKVLSISKALPLQLHPNKELSAKIHSKDSEKFTDPNHKPEIALALTKFEAFCGFKPLDQVSKLVHLEPLKQFLPAVQKPSFDDMTLKHFVNTVLKADEDTIAKVQEELKKLPKASFGGDSYIPDLIPRLQSQYEKTDPGTIVALITMNYLVLDPGQSIYIPADGIHAYLSGDIIECMARSNNVLNVGFCPAADRDSADLFCSVLTFSPHSPDEALLKQQSYPGSVSGKTNVFKPPMSEFNMLTTELGAGEKETLKPVKGPGIMIVTKGAATMKAQGKDFELKEGAIFFIGQGVETSYEAKDGLQMFTAYVE